MTGAKRRAELAVYHFRRMRWALRADRLLRDTARIDAPIFIVGVQGGGATLLSRMLRRSPGVVTLSGDHDYWTGADEMQTGMDLVLPREFSGLLGNSPPHPVFAKRRGWAYACDELLPWYRGDASDFRPDAARRFRRAVQACITMHGGSRGSRTRFLDKSQSYALKIPLLRKVLDGSEPRFVALTRDPWASCWRAAARTTHLSRAPLPIEERVRIAAEHWDNSFSAAKAAGGVLFVRFEDLLLRPEDSLRSVCDFVDLPFGDDLLPAAHHTIPFGTKRGERWHPIRTDVNDRYLREIPTWAIDVVAERCGELARELRYDTPGPFG